MNIRNQKAFSMVEVVVAALILSIGVVGVFATMSSQKTPTFEAEQKVQAALAAKQFLEDLRSKVNAEEYQSNTGPLAIGNHNTNITVGGNTYAVNYSVTAAGAGGNARKVDLTISW